MTSSYPDDERPRYLLSFTDPSVDKPDGVWTLHGPSGLAVISGSFARRAAAEQWAREQIAAHGLGYSATAGAQWRPWKNGWAVDLDQQVWKFRLETACGEFRTETDLQGKDRLLTKLDRQERGTFIVVSNDDGHEKRVYTPGVIACTFYSEQRYLPVPSFAQPGSR